MYIQSDLENKPYKISKRNFLDDYAHYTSNEVDMTLSGKYLYKYPKFTIDYSDFSKYPTHSIVKDLIGIIKSTQNIKKIKDQNVKQRMPEVFGDAEEHAQAYSKKLGKYVMLENKDGKWQINDKVEPAKPTMRSIISIDEQGEKIEREVPHALMKTNRDDKEIAVTYGQYGEINIETVDVLPCQERIARGVREQGETSKGEESAELRRQFETSGKEYTHNLAHQVEKIEEAQKESNQIEPNEISENNYIPNTDTTWKELMEETGESLPELVERYNKDMAASGGKEEPKNIIQRIIEDYQMVSHEHKR